jgi:4-amino-4-deoxy-L-arabinose transferase-like glycosyltransferase
MSFYKLGQNDLSEWDESRNGVNAFEMLHNGDYINLYYGGQPDSWNNKPPLFIYAIVMCYKLFGYNEFALRFTSALAIIIFFVFIYKLIALYESTAFAFICCLVMMTCKGIVGNHVGRSGDFDATLLCLLIISIYYLLCYIDFNKETSLNFSALFFGFAFLIKGAGSFYWITRCHFVYYIEREI